MGGGYTSSQLTTKLKTLLTTKLKTLHQALHSNSHHTSPAFALPTLVVTATILMVAAVSVAQTTVTISNALRSQSYGHLADEAVQAGIAYATSCLNKTTTSYWTSALTPKTTCAGTSNSGNDYIEQNSQYTSTFAVATPDTSGTKPKAYVTGTVTLANSTKQYVAKGVAIVNVASSQTTTTLPTSPVDGQEVYYQVYTNGQLSGNTGLWHLRYNAATTYWDFLGGVAMSSPPTATVSNGTATPYASNAYVCLPLNGDYDVTYGDLSTQNYANTSNQMVLSLWYNATASHLDSGYVQATGLYGGAAIQRSYRVAGITGASGASRYLQMFYRSDSNQPSYFNGIFVKVTPVRVKS